MLSCQKWDLDRTDFPEIELLGIEALSLSTIRVEGNLTGLLEGQVTEQGFLWSSIDQEPSINLVNTTKENLGASFTNGSFSFDIEGLVINTTYYIRAFVIFNEQVLYLSLIHI